MRTENARVTHAQLGWDHGGMFVVGLTFAYGNGASGQGWYAVPGMNMAETVQQILRVCGVEDWSKVKGSVLRVVATHAGVVRFGHIVDDLWYETGFKP